MLLENHLYIKKFQLIPFSYIQIQLDTTNQQINYVIQRLLSDSYTSFLEGLLSDCDFETVGNIFKFLTKPIKTGFKMEVKIGGPTLKKSVFSRFQPFLLISKLL